MISMFAKNFVSAMFVIAFFCSLLVEGKPAVSNGKQNSATVCKLPLARGRCRAAIPRWGYHPSTGRCQEFYFGGCDGNANNFESYKACMSVCKGIA